MIKESSKEIQDSQLDLIDPTFAELKENFNDLRTQDFGFRKTMLKSMLRGAREMEKEFLKALYDDLRIDAATAYMLNLFMFVSDLKDSIDHFESWAKPKSKATSISFFPGKSSLKPQPRGVV